MKEKVLIVDDEKSIVGVLSYALDKEGFIVEKAYDGEDALKKVDEFSPEIILLDVMMPKFNGYDVCKKLDGKNIGILMLTAKTDIVDKVLGLELGADDYITKPFDIREVIARVKSLARRVNKNRKIDDNNDNIIKIKDLYIDKNQRLVKIGDSKVEFTAMEFDLLYMLLKNTKLVYSREQLLDKVWGIEYIGGTRTVDTHIQRIRKKLGEQYQNLIKTVHGIGYKGVDVFCECGD